MIGATVCSGIGAPEVAMPWVDWRFAAEIEAAPRAIFAHHHPGVELFGDFTEMRHDPRIGEIELLVGGTPCQSFSIAGLRGSLDDDRGNLALEFIRLADAIDDIRRAAGQPDAYILWENVPGVLSVADNAFGAFLGGLVGSESPIVSDGGWSNAGVVSGPRRVAAWRILDAQHFGVAQRRRRVFVLAHGHSRGWRCADALLPVSNRLQGHPAPRRQAGPGVAAVTANGVGTCGADDNQGQAGHLIAAEIAETLRAGGNRTGGDRPPGTDVDTASTYLIASTGNTAHCLNAGGMGQQDYETETLIAHSLRGEGFDASEDGTGRGTPLVPVAGQASAVRRLTPTECLRLQGFPDDYFDGVMLRGKPLADGPKYKALGNSMAVPCMAWLGQRIQLVEDRAAIMERAA